MLLNLNIKLKAYQQEGENISLYSISSQDMHNAF